MLTPLQISTQRFTPNGKGGYKSSEVDAFVQKVYKYYNKLFNDNNALSQKLDSVLPVIEEYNKNKAVIANVLISAQTAADSKLEAANAAVEKLIVEAEAKAQSAYNERVAQADAYYEERTREADRKLTELERSYNRLKADSDYYKNKYLAEIKGRVDDMIISANEKAASIVSAAFEDAKAARVRSDLIIDEANVELKKLYAQAGRIKAELDAVIALATKVSGNIVDFEPLEKSEFASKSTAFEPITADDLPEFDFEEAEQEHKSQESDAVAEEVSESDAEVQGFDDAEYVEGDAPENNEVYMGEFEDIQSYTNYADYESYQEETAEEDDITIYEKDEIVSAADVPFDIFSDDAVTQEQQSAEIPDVNSYLSKIFDSLSSDDEADSFGFDDLISESSDS